MWCGGLEHDHEQWDQHFSEALHSLGWNKGVGKGGYKGWNEGGYKGYPKGGSKGSSNDFKGVGKGGFNKGVPKGDGQGKGGKGGGCNGYCPWCAEWGHSQSRCREKGEFMENQRSNGKGNSMVVTIRLPTMLKRKDTFGEIWVLSLLVLFGTPWKLLCYFEPVRGTARTR